MAAIESPGDRTSEVGLLKSQIKDERLALPVRADEAAAAGLPGRGGGLMSTRGGSAASRNSRPAAARRRSSRSSPAPRIAPDVVRSLIGLALMLIGVATLIGLMLPGEGKLTDWWRDSIAPWFGSGRRVLPFLILIVGWWMVERAKGVRGDWELTAFGHGGRLLREPGSDRALRAEPWRDHRQGPGAQPAGSDHCTWDRGPADGGDDRRSAAGAGHVSARRGRAHRTACLQRGERAVPSRPREGRGPGRRGSPTGQGRQGRAARPRGHCRRTERQSRRRAGAVHPAGNPESRAHLIDVRAAGRARRHHA